MKNLQELIAYHTQRHEGLQPEDVYKLLFQGVLGPEHLLSNPDAAKRYLFDEWQKVDGDHHEELIEEISIDEKYVRVNLRPFKARQIDLEILWNAFLHAAKMNTMAKSEFIVLWNEYMDLCHKQLLDFAYECVRAFDQLMYQKNYPPAHHSRLYREKNKPAYRVVVKNEIVRLIEKEPIHSME